MDIYCLGVKNAFCNANVPLKNYEELKYKIFQDAPSVNCDIKLANDIIYGAMEYARKLGFEPQKDFAISKFVLEEQADCNISSNIKFGKEGKPLYISGPDDDIDYVLNKLVKNAGEGNFDLIIPEQ